ncbi:hypothetical protein UNH65_19585 [Chitinophaga sp. 180180018-2]|nr:hypothetical protein [Chitinophaga sp. 212800010-3]
MVPIGIIGSILQYEFISNAILKDIDEQLARRLKFVTLQLKKDSVNYVPWLGVHSDIDIKPLGNKLKFSPQYYTVYKEGISKKFVKVRYLEACVETTHSNYIIKLKQVNDESTKIIWDVTVNVILICLMLLVALVILTLVISKTLWKPFYIVVGRLKTFRIDQPINDDFPKSSIREFQVLSDAISIMTNYSRQQFIQQKQFAENASHEIQTPLTIALSGLDDLMQSEHLEVKSIKSIQRTKDALYRLSNLTQGLLLLAKIDNQQFKADGMVNVSEIINNLLHIYNDFALHSQITIVHQIKENINLYGHPYLYEVLFSNLIKNAMLHGSKGKVVQIELSHAYFRISNEGEPLSFDESLIFDRFVKTTNRSDSAGLGLALVKQIGGLYGMTVRYNYTHKTKQHEFNIEF